MANMSYCRFHNTLLALQDCEENMDDPDISDSESGCRERLIELCRRIAEYYNEDYDFETAKPEEDEEDE